jgi:hypothetical protein
VTRRVVFATVWLGLFAVGLALWVQALIDMPRA